MTRHTSHQKGLRAEQIASWFLRLKGYAILETRYKTPFGEIDILAKKGQALICVEVKYRCDQDRAIEAVNPYSQKRIIAAAEFYRARQPRYLEHSVRFDVVTISGIFSIRHHQNAWYDS